MSQRITKNAPRPFKRAGLHKLECPACPGYAYATVAMLESIGRPVCACGETLEPATLDLALELRLEDHPLVIDYRRRAVNKDHSQSRAVGGRQKQLARAEHLASMDLRAYEEIRSEERSEARTRRVAALNRGSLQSAPITARAALTRDTDPIPF